MRTSRQAGSRAQLGSKETPTAPRNTAQHNSVEAAVEMIYKTLAYVAIMVGGTISGGLAASFVGPIRILLSGGDTTMIGACLGAIAAILGCWFAIEHRQAAERNRELLRIVESRVARVVHLRPTLSR